jgi:hypothetical protein
VHGSVKPDLSYRDITEMQGRDGARWAVRYEFYESEPGSLGICVTLRRLGPIHETRHCYFAVSSGGYDHLAASALQQVQDEL